MKRTFSLLMVLILSITCAALPVSAEEIVYPEEEEIIVEAPLEEDEPELYEEEDIEVVPAPVEEEEIPEIESIEERAVTTLTLTKDTKTTLNVGDKLQIKLEGATIAKAQSKKEKIASVSADGLVTALSEGSSAITITDSNKKKVKLTVTVVDPYKPTGVSFAKTSLTINVGEEYALTPVLAPASAKTTFTYKSSKSKVASVSTSGVVKALTEGTAKITVTTSNKKKATVTIKVVDPYKPDSIKFEKSSYTVNVGEELTLKPILTPSTAKTTYTWKSAKSKVASVSASGVVKALTEGSAKITVTTSNKKKATVTIKVIDPYKPDSIKFEKSSYTVNVGDQLTLNPILTPSTAKTTYTWKSAKAKVASVSTSGVVKGLTEGTAKITVTTANKKKTTVTIKVIDPYKPDSIKLEKSSYTVNVGDQLTLNPILTPSTAKTTYTWKSAKAKVASVSTSGVVKGLTEGTAKITVTTANKKKATVTINVVDASKPTGVKFDKASYSLNVGEKKTLTPVLTPTTAKTSYTWKCSDTNVATVSSGGVVTAVNPGTATITVTTANKLTASTSITVSIDPEAITSLTLSKDYVILKSYDVVKLTASYSPASANPTLTWESDNSRINVTDEGSVGSYGLLGTATVTCKSANGLVATCKVRSCLTDLEQIFVQNLSVDRILESTKDLMIKSSAGYIGKNYSFSTNSSGTVYHILLTDSSDGWYSLYGAYPGMNRYSADTKIKNYGFRALFSKTGEIDYLYGGYIVIMKYNTSTNAVTSISVGKN